MINKEAYNYHGFGVGLRPCHYSQLDDPALNIDWFELLTEDYLVDGGINLHYLDQIAANYPCTLHGVSLSIGSCDPLNQHYLTKLRNLCERAKPLWVSDHFCWTGVNKVNLHDLMPLPYTQECINHLVTRIKAVQDFLGQRILLENISSYIDYKASTMTEWEFISEVSQLADCFLLLDINNVYVNAHNHQFNPTTFIDYLPLDRVRQFHIAGHLDRGLHLIDTHDAAVIDPVWDLYARALTRFPDAALILERDANIPSLPEMSAELAIARGIKNSIGLEV